MCIPVWNVYLKKITLQDYLFFMILVTNFF
ncbi:Uncharacterised protein [Enterobacter cloacae]|nr:Uncharacterised protein [Enterobacter cloacae]